MIEFDFKQEVVKLAPPATVSGITLAGFTVQEWVYLATIFYILVQSFVLIYTTLTHTERKRKDGNTKDESE